MMFINNPFHFFVPSFSFTVWSINSSNYDEQIEQNLYPSSPIVIILCILYTVVAGTSPTIIVDYTLMIDFNPPKL